MRAGIALLTVFLAGPALAAPPTPAREVSNAAIMARINAADPSLTPSPTSIDELVAVAELAERKLAAATDPNDVGELLTHVGTAREIAHERTNAAEHLCKVLVAAASVQAREGMPANLYTEAAAFTDTARSTLASLHAGHTCPTDRGEPRTVKSKPLVVLEPTPVRRQRRPKVARLTVAGGVVVGTAAALTLGLVGVRVHRGRAGDKLADIRAAVDAAGGKSIAQSERVAELEAINTWTRAATVGLAVSAAAVGVLGVSLIASGVQRRIERPTVAPYGSAQGAGLVLRGHF